MRSPHVDHAGGTKRHERPLPSGQITRHPLPFGAELAAMTMPAIGAALATAPEHSRALSTGELDLVGLLCAITELSNDGGGPLESLRRAVDVVLRHTGWAIGSIWLIGPSGGLIPVEAGSAGDTSTFDASALHGGGRGLPGRVTASRRPAWIEDIHNDDDFPRVDAAAAEGLRAAFGLPILAGPNVVAVLEFFARQEVTVDSRLPQVMAAIGIQLGRAFERDEALQETKTAVADARRILSAAGDAFVGIDGDGMVTGWNDRAEAMFGWTSAEALGRPASEFIVTDVLGAAHHACGRPWLASNRATVVGDRIEMEGLRRNGERFPLEISFWAVRSGIRWGFYSLCRDITDRKAHEADLAHRALHDELTGLAKRSLAIERINHALTRRARHGLDVAVLFLDLDRFKVINDSFGHHAGDELLRAVARRVSSAVRPGDTIARMAGDEFAIICDELLSPADARRLAHRILQALSRPIDVADGRIRIGASVGIALAESAGDSAEGLLRDADAAMYWAKRHGRGQVAVFDVAMRSRRHNGLRTKPEVAE